MNHNKGITLIETMVAVTVLTFALGGPYVLASQSLQAAGYAREEVLASRLGEEALEMVHSIRDNFAVDGNNWGGAGATAWNTLISNCVSNACALSMPQQGAGGSGVASTIWNTAAVIPCGAATCASSVAKDVYLNPTTGVYAQFSAVPGAAWAKETITREITLAPITLPSGGQTGEYTITVTVNYQAGRVAKTIKVRDTIRDWFPRLPL